MGPYEILTPLGAGGMGEVYRARDSRLDRDVAIKVLPERMASDGMALGRFEREAKAVAALSHPNILAIHDFGQQDGLAYAVMELLEGETLRVMIARGPLSLRKVSEYGAQVAQGLAAAHDRGIVHRDLKPENLFITRNGPIKILDFGLAQLQPGVKGHDAEMPTAPRHTDPGTVLGTAGYMSPEQVRGQPVDGRSDIFTLGCVLYEMLTGHQAFRGETTAETMAAILRDDPPPLMEAQSEVPLAFEHIVWHCLEKKAEDRFQSARDVAFDLANLSASSVGRRAITEPRHPARRVAWVGWALALVAAAAVGFVGRGLREVGRRAPRPATFTQLTDLPGIEQSARLSPDGQTIALVSRASGNADVYLQRARGHNPINLTKDCEKDDGEPAFSPDGDRIAFRSECGGTGIFVMGATGESRLRVTDFGHDPAWSPDGKRIAVATVPAKDPLVRPIESQIWLVEVATGEKRLLVSADSLQPSFSPRGWRIAYWGLRGTGGTTGQRDLWTVPVEGGPAVEVTNDAAVDWNPVWTPDGRSLVFASSRGGSMNLWRVEVDEASGRPAGDPLALNVPTLWAGGVGLSRDGRQLVYATREARSVLYRADFDPARGVLMEAPKPSLGGSREVRHVAVSPDGQWIAFTNGGVQEDLFVVRVDGTGYRQLTDDGARDRGPDWSPDASQIAFYSNRGGPYEIWTIRSDGSGLARLVAGSSRIPTWAPDGGRLSIVDGGGRRGSYIVQAGGSLEDPGTRRLPEIPGGLTFWGVAWSPSGGHIAGGGVREDGVAAGLFRYSLESGTYDRLTPPPPQLDEVPSLSWLPGGRHIAYAEGGGLYLLDTLTRRGRELLPPGTLDVGVRTFSFSKDGKTLVYGKTTFEGDVWLMTQQ